MKFHSHIMSLIVKPVGSSIFDERATFVTLEDEAAGLYIKMTQTHDDSKPGEICFDKEEWLVLKDAIEQLLKVIDKHQTL